MNALLKFITLPTICAALAAATVQAQENPVELSGDVKVVVTTTDENGVSKTEFLTPEKVVPGDRLLFSTDYRNAGDEPVDNFVITNPLPSAVLLAPEADPELIVSVDGGKSWAELAELSVTLDDGSSRPAEHSDVTHIRWTLAVVEPGESGRVKFPAIIR